MECIHQWIAASLQQITEPVFHGCRHTGPTLSLTTADEVRKVLTTTRLKQSPTDVLPTSLLRSSVDVFAPVIAHIANLSFTECRFPAAFKTVSGVLSGKEPCKNTELKR